MNREDMYTDVAKITECECGFKIPIDRLNIMFNRAIDNIMIKLMRDINYLSDMMCKELSEDEVDDYIDTMMCNILDVDKEIFDAIMHGEYVIKDVNNYEEK